MTAQSVVSRDVANGQWKFTQPEVPHFEVFKLAEELRDGPEGQFYERLEIRKSGKNETAILFIYRHDGSKREHQGYFHRMREYLENRFGKGNVHWDVSSSIQILK